MSTKTDSALRNLRRTRTISQATLAKLSGVSQKTISQAEAGKVQLRTDVQARIAAILGTTREELFHSSETFA